MKVKDVMGVEEFAKFAMAHPDTVRRKCRSGELLAAKAGKRWMILARDWLDGERARRSEPGTMKGGSDA